MQNPKNGMIKSKARIIKESWNRATSACVNNSKGGNMFEVF
jgi:hypothetical protein